MGYAVYKKLVKVSSKALLQNTCMKKSKISDKPGVTGKTVIKMEDKEVQTRKLHKER